MKRKNNGNLNNVENPRETSQNPTPPPAANNSLELTHIEENKERLLRFNGKINGYSAWILLDSGASRNFINEQFVKKHGFATKPATPTVIR